MSRHLFGPRADLAVFAGPTLLGLGVWALAPRGSALLAHTRGLPEWAWVAFVLLVDVGHVWSTLFRTYLDGDEWRKRRALYVLAPLACLALGVAAYAAFGARGFWRGLAYVAVLHFVRQQAGWVAIFAAKSGPNDAWDRVVDRAAIYLATLGPLFVWHTDLERPFSWFVAGDFVSLAGLASLRPLAGPLVGAALVAFAARQGWRARKGLPVSVGKCVVVASTAVSWWVGIVVAKDDLAFTALNVLPHGVPYFVLLHRYARAREAEAPRLVGSRLVGAGAVVFLAVPLGLAFVEEALWDRLVWLDRAWLFGWLPAVEGGPMAVVVPLLALPQATHYVLDAVLWRRRDTGAAQANALGFG